MHKLTVRDFFTEKKDDLKLELLGGKEGLSRSINNSEINRPGLTFTGYTDHFSSERIQVIGLGEYSYLKSLSPKKQNQVLRKIFSFSDIPCFILARNLKPLPSMIAAHKQNNIPLLRTQLTTSRITAELITYLEEKMSESTNVHGVLIRVYGLGVLIVGDAGIGKSECALELIKRNHLLVADDVVVVNKHSGNVLIGSREKTIQYHMELRGLGIIDVYSLFGVGSTMENTKIELVVRLEEWVPNKEYERIGLEDQYTTILGVKIPEVIYPVRPGRNIAVLIEIASLNQRLKNMGMHSAQELNKRLISMMTVKG